MGKRRRSIFVRVTEDEKERIARGAARAGISVSEFIRRASLGKEVKPFPTDAFFHVRNELEKIYADFHEGMSEETERDFIRILSELNRKFLLPEKERR